MRKVKLVFLLAIAVGMYACGGDESEPVSFRPEGEAPQQEESQETATAGGGNKGIGEVEDVELTDPLDEEMINEGQMIYDMKCASCHKLSDQRVVGPGWAGITNNRTPEWIMNMITNVDVMLAEDPEAQALLEECLVRMPNQNVSITDARSILEFMRHNDMETVGSKDEAAE